MDMGRYLERISVAGPLPPTVETLQTLQRAQMLSVPFESYDCALGRPVSVDPEINYAKVVDRRRGGFCFELNGLFSQLLESLGFEVTLLSARPYSIGHEAEAEPEFAHLALLVPVDGERWLVDVGFGDGSLEPLSIDHPEDIRAGATHRIAPGVGDGPWSVLQTVKDDEAEAYFFTLEPRRLDDFRGMCESYSTSPESWFVTSPVCSMATPTGRVTLFQRNRLITTDAGVRTERPVENEADELEILRDRFGVDLGRASD